MGMLGLFVLVNVVLMVYARGVIKEKIKFTEEDWEYMYEYIDEEFGNGEHFQVISNEETMIIESGGVQTYTDGTTDYDEEILGKRVTFIGYFDSQEELYGIVFCKYLEEQPLYKDGKAGTVICTAVNTNYSKEDYLKGIKEEVQ